MRYLKILLAILFTFSTVSAQQKSNNESIESLINESIWKPFKSSYEARDWETFNSLHTDDVLRVYDNVIKIGAEYKNSIQESYQREQPGTVTIDFVMERRTYRNDVGYEVGFYRVIYKESGKEDRHSYGRFHVVIRKVNGSWKIAQDWDSNSFNGKPITTSDFDSSKMLRLEN